MAAKYNLNNDFLQLYKELESLMRSYNEEYKSIEDNCADENEQQHYRMCRVMRNYMSHQPDPQFLQASEGQIQFLKDKIAEYKMKEDTVKKHIGSLQAYTCSLSDKCGDVLARMTKRQLQMMPVYSVIRNVEKMSVVSIYDVAAAYLESKSKKIADVKPLKRAVEIVSPECLMRDLDHNNTTYFCRNEKGKMLGYVITDGSR